MNNLLHIFSWFYKVILGLLPQDFQTQFKEEMCHVFGEALREAEQKGLFPLLAVFWREIWDMPGMLLAEHWTVYTQLSGGARTNPPAARSMTWLEWSSEMETNTNTPKTPWRFVEPRLSWAAALPPLIFGNGCMLTILAVPTRSLYLIVAVWVLTVLVITAGAIVALVRRFPDWGYTWMGSALMLGAVSLYVWADELAETGRYILSQAGDIALMGCILLAGFILLVLAARRGWQMAGLVSIAYASMFGLFCLASLNNAPFKRMDLELLALPVGLALAGIIFIYGRVSDTGRIFLLAAVWAVNAGIFFIAHQVWQTWLTTRGGVSPLIPLLVFSTGFVLSGPVIGLVSKPFFRLLGRV